LYVLPAILDRFWDQTAPASLVVLNAILLTLSLIFVKAVLMTALHATVMDLVSVVVYL